MTLTTIVHFAPPLRAMVFILIPALLVALAGCADGGEGPAPTDPPGDVATPSSDGSPATGLEQDGEGAPVGVAGGSLATNLLFLKFEGRNYQVSEIAHSVSQENLERVGETVYTDEHGNAKRRVTVYRLRGAVSNVLFTSGGEVNLDEIADRTGIGGMPTGTLHVWLRWIPRYS